ncbi:MAG: GH92 family glycosyl hydrolase, partial [Verrucomicrobiota bacterium]|nr:GH92 family glycosyl hydrolase [Verrucomicrobiota bacterium]
MKRSKLEKKEKTAIAGKPSDDARALSRRQFIRSCAIGTSALTFVPLAGCRETPVRRTPSSASQPEGGAPSTGNRLLWRIGAPDHSGAGFALAPDGYTLFQEFFGKPDHAYYIGLSQAKTGWPYVLPGPLDGWSGCGQNGRWDVMNTLPIGFVLAQAPANGQCAFIINVCDAQPEHPPRLRITINGAIFERQLTPGGSDDSLKGHLQSARPQVVRVEFPSSLLRIGYNEIALRNTQGSWFIFDSLQLETPTDFKLAPPSRTVIRSVTVAPYAVSSDAQTPATLRVELFRAGAPGKLAVRIGDGKAEARRTESGLQILEIPAPASPAGGTTRIRLSAGGRLLCDTPLALRASPPVTPADYVDVFMGTAHSRWMIAPGPWMPFSMVKISPDNQSQGWCAGYEYSHEYIDRFSHIHEWTMAGLGVTPTVGPLRTRTGLDGAGYSSRFDKSTERGGIGFYEVFLKDSGIKAELAATTRASLQRYTFPASDEARVLLGFLLPNEYEMHVLGARVRRAAPAEIEGVIQTDLPNVGYNGNQRFHLHFVMQFSRPFEELGGWQYPGGAEVTIQSGADRPSGESSEEQGAKIISHAPELALAGDCGAFVNFKTAAGEKILVRTGISLVSLENARQNLEQELARPFGWDFEAVIQIQRRTWNEIFNRIGIGTPDAREKTRFYTNLYRALSGRNTWSDVNGEWMDPFMRRQKLDDPANVMLGSDALWTTFWNMNQVMNLLSPEWSVRWVKSELQLYDKCGWTSKGPAGLKYISVMVAEHEIPLMVAAHQHGLKGIDGRKVLEAAAKMQTTMPELFSGDGAAGNANLENYLKNGYVAEDGPIGPGGKAEWNRAWTSNTYEYAYDDWCVAQLARALGREDTAAEFLKRSQSWRKVFDVKTGYARPRKANGDWLAPFDPYRTRGFVEGCAWQYTWFVPQDPAGLVRAMGRDRFISRLSAGFEKSAPERFNGGSHAAVDQGNQPTMQVAWLFNWAGAPWLTQKWARAILEAYYGFNPADAYLGDEDQGQMSSWFVMSSIGLFEMDGGCRVNPIYEIGSPLYPKITIH